MGEAKRRGTRVERIEELLKNADATGMTPERYNAFVAWTRSPIAQHVGLEVEFFSSTSETLIAVLVQDNYDRDYGYVVLGRDLKGRFRAIMVSFATGNKNDGWNKTTARHELFKALQKLHESGQTVFPQMDEDSDKAGVDLFQTQLPQEQQHFAFKKLNTEVHWEPAKKIMLEMMKHFIDVDGNFVQQFQTTAFDARIWELYLYAALLEIGLFVNKEHEAPDFEVSDGRKKVYIEAVIAGPSPMDDPLEIDADSVPQMRDQDEILELLKTRAPIRFGSALYSKLNRKTKYWELEHVKGNPLVFAIADFHETQSMTWTSPALLQYLYGVSHDFVYDDSGNLVITPLKIDKHEYKGKQIPSGFFLQPGSENISAVLFSSSGTISKFNRMGMLAGFGAPEQSMFRAGLKHKHDQNAAFPEPFFLEVKQGEMQESWAEGLSMFHNPTANIPIDHNMFPHIAHHWLEDGQIKSLLPEFHVYSSYTINNADPKRT